MLLSIYWHSQQLLLCNIVDAQVLLGKGAQCKGWPKRRLCGLRGPGKVPKTGGELPSSALPAVLPSRQCPDYGITCNSVKCMLDHPCCSAINALILHGGVAAVTAGTLAFFHPPGGSPVECPCISCALSSLQPSLIV